MSLKSQPVFSEVIEVDSANLSVLNFKLIDSSFYIVSIYFGNELTTKSSFVKFSCDEQKTEMYNLDSFGVSIGNPLYFEDYLVLYGKDRNFNKSIEIKMVDREFNELSSNIVPTKADLDWPSPPVTIGNNIYISSYIEDGEQEYSMIASLDVNLSERWKKYFNEEYPYSYPFGLDVSIDNKILATSNVLDGDSRRFYNQLLKLDTSGNVIWEFFNDEELRDGAVAPYFTTLSDSSIVISYTVDRFGDRTFPNHLHPFPYKLIWLDHQGNLIKRKYYHTPRGNAIFILGLESGLQDGFYFFGTIEGTDIGGIKASLVKLDNFGDTVFYRSYYHPEYPLGEHQFYARDIHEFENGDIAVLSMINTSTDFNKIWIFMVDSNGNCLHEDCISEGGLVGFQTHEVNYNQLTLYPNPTSNIISWLSEIQLKEVKILDFLGRVVDERDPNLFSNELNVSGLSSGTYFILGKGIDDKIYRSKFIKQ
jgi:hypothetical protein